MKTIQEIKSNFEQILSDVIKIQGLPVESATQVAAVILQESGKFERTEILNNNRNGNNNSNGNDKPITEKQTKFLQDLGVNELPKTSREASRLIEQLRGNGKGRYTARSFPK